MDLDARTKPQTPNPLAKADESAEAAPTRIIKVATTAIAVSVSGKSDGSPQGQSETVELSASHALDRSQNARTRFSLVVGVMVMLVVITLSSQLGGEARARYLFQAGIGWMAFASTLRIWILRNKPQWHARVPEGVFGIIIQVGLLPGLYYFGPFSGVTIALPVGLILVGLDRNQRSGILLLTFVLGMHLFVALPIIIGTTTDISLLPSTGASTTTLALSEIMILALIGASYVLMRCVRRMSITALAELANAKRVIGDQKLSRAS